MRLNESHIPQIQNLTNLIQEKIGGIDIENQKRLDEGLTTYANNIIKRMSVTASWENNRSYISIIIFAFYLVVSGLAFLGFFKGKPSFLLGLSIILLFSLPIIIIFEGVLTTYYFIYSDACQDVHDAIYQNKFPIAEVGFGFLTSCFTAKTRASLYSFSYQLDSVEADIKNKIAAGGNYDFAYLQAQIKEFKQGNLEELLSCRHVYESYEFVEKRLCVNGMKWANQLITFYSWLFIIILLCAYAVNRMKPLVEKKKNEIESMRMNEDLLE